MPKTKTGPPRSSSSIRKPPAPPGAASHGAEFCVVGIGASAGGLEACRKLVEALPLVTGMAFILVQHLDPTHESLLVDLLAENATVVVQEALENMLIEPDHLYVIPPGRYLSVGGGALHLSEPQARHGARLPVDFLLRSLADTYGNRAVGVILSGTGSDGSDGLRAIKDGLGLVIAQDPEEAGYDGMPRSAIATGEVDLVLAAAAMPKALADYDRSLFLGPATGVATEDWLPGIVELLRTRTAHDFSLYKTGTLRRRIERRMAMANVRPDAPERYLERLRHDPAELDLLAKDLLINVTSFFRDPKVFELLATKIIPDALANRSSDQPFRLWIAGCSSGEETYSLAMIFRERIDAAKLNVKLQIFASDVDPDSVASAREGLYPETIATTVSAARLARFFSKEKDGYRVSPELRGSVVFAVQDVLADPPFSRLDMVSCRNLLIYLGPEAQVKVLTLFHFALREGGLLLLGSAETPGPADARFEVISKPARLYRHVGRSRPGELGFLMRGSEAVRVPPRGGAPASPTRQAALAELCRQKVVEKLAPAAVLINAKNEYLYSVGPTDRYLRPAPGHPTVDLLAMSPPALRTKLRSAIQRATDENSRVVVPGGRTERGGASVRFDLDVQPVSHDGEDLLLVCFIDVPARATAGGRGVPDDPPQFAELKHELDATRTELQGAIRNLEASGEAQKAINEEALSVNEEYQSTNEELLTSKEELQSLNEELTALNTQLQETLERQRTTSNDLQNVLYSTDVATVFLDADLKIRLFTPATKSLFNVIPGDVGRPLADLNSLASDGALLTDAKMVLETLVPVEKEIEARSGAWYVRRILPYRTEEDGVEGVVITFVDISERKHTADAVAIAEQRAQTANSAKSRFLAAASHDLRQPLQALSLMRGVLAKKIRENKKDEALALVSRLDETAATMAGMLNTMLDINQIEAGIVQAETASFAIGGLIERLRDEFSYPARAKGLSLHAVTSRLTIESDPRLLEQVLRNLLANALKYTSKGKVLIGCRRHGGMLSIEICDTGVGIAEAEQQAIFEEYRQLDNAGHERSRGIGLGLSIVKRLTDLMGHRISVRSQAGRGSIFCVEVELAAGTTPVQAIPVTRAADAGPGDGTGLTGVVMIIDDDPEVLELLGVLLAEEGHRTVVARDGVAALEMADRGLRAPDVILTDYNLPHGLNGLELSARLRQKFQSNVPVVILTGDISTDTLKNVARADCVQLNKPVDPVELTAVVRRMLTAAHAAPNAPDLADVVKRRDTATIFVVDDDSDVLGAIRMVLEEAGRTVETYATSEAFLAAYLPGSGACLLVDAHLPGMGGLDLLQRLNVSGKRLPSIMITGQGDVATAVRAMRYGASDFIEKPIGRQELLESIARAMDESRGTAARFAQHDAAGAKIAALTPRERQIMEMVLAGHPSKNIAADLGISQRTVENHRASVMKKTDSKSLPALTRLAVAAAWKDGLREIDATPAL